MKRMRFIDEDLEDRASVLVENGKIIKVKRKGKKTIALYELYGRPVEVVMEGEEVKSIDFIHPTETKKLASFITRGELKDLLKELIT